MKAKEFIPTSRPRNFVAKNAQTAGAGRHRDSSKKKDQEQGKVKHKKDLMPMEADRGFRGVGGARGRENDENDKIDAQIRADYEKKKQYEMSGKFWLKQKDTQQHISDEFVGKAAANAAAVALLKQQPELKGNLLITAYGPGEQRESAVAELSSAKLGQYKTAAGAQASAADKAGDTKKADRRFSGIVKATKKQFANDAKGVAEATGDKPFDNMMNTIKKGTAKQKTADRRAEKAHSQQRARDAFGPNPAAGLGIRKPGVAEGESALEKFRRNSDAREKKHDEIERKRKEAAGRGKENMSGAIDRLEKHLATR